MGNKKIFSDRKPREKIFSKTHLEMIFLINAYFEPLESQLKKYAMEYFIKRPEVEDFSTISGRVKCTLRYLNGLN